jgi:hypothetical protein
MFILLNFYQLYTILIMKILGVDPGSRITGFERGNSSRQLLAFISNYPKTIFQGLSSRGFASLGNKTRRSGL